MKSATREDYMYRLLTHTLCYASAIMTKSLTLQLHYARMLHNSEDFMMHFGRVIYKYSTNNHILLMRRTCVQLNIL